MTTGADRRHRQGMVLGPKTGFGAGSDLATEFGFAGGPSLSAGDLAPANYAFLLAKNDSAVYVRTRGLESGAVYHDLIGKVA